MALNSCLESLSLSLHSNPCTAKGKRSLCLCTQPLTKRGCAKTPCKDFFEIEYYVGCPKVEKKRDNPTPINSEEYIGLHDVIMQSWGLF